jgi:hypothetical protein
VGQFAHQFVCREYEGIHRIPHFIKLDFNDTNVMIHLNWNRDQCYSVVNTATNLWVP